MSTPRIMCLTADGLPYSHVEQVQDFCFAGAEWIQLRSKQLSDCELEPIAFEALQVCRQYGSRLLINDRLDLALNIEADGAHLGRQDGDWAQARARAGKDFLLGGTVNCLADARAALASQALDYCGVGPYKFTRTKAQLARLLKPEDWRTILQLLSALPCYAIGGIELSDLPDLASYPLRGLAICSALHRDGRRIEHYSQFIEQYENTALNHCG